MLQKEQLCVLSAAARVWRYLLLYVKSPDVQSPQPDVHLGKGPPLLEVFQALTVEESVLQPIPKGNRCL